MKYSITIAVNNLLYMYVCKCLLLNISDPFKYSDTQQDNAMIIITLLINIFKTKILNLKRSRD